MHHKHSLVELVDHVRRNSAFYRDLYRDLPARLPGDFAVTDLPVTPHTGYWAAAGLADSRVLTGPLDDAIIFRSGGTTGAPKFVAYRNAEWAAFTGAFGRGMADLGFEPGDRVANLFYGGDLYASLLFITGSLASTPVPITQLPIGGATPVDAMAQTITELGATAVAGTVSTACRLAEYLTDTGRQLTGVRLVMFGGEAFHDDRRPLLAAAFPNATIRSIGYASVDAGLLGRSLPGHDPRRHATFAADTILEIVDEHTGRPITQPGVAGKILVTNLTRRLMPVLRYPAGDRAEWIDQAGGTFRLLGRSEEGVRVGPVALYYRDVHDLVSAVDGGGQVNGMQLLLRRRDGKDELTLRIAAAGANLDELRAAIAHRLDSTRPTFADHVRLGVIHPLAVEWSATADLAVNPRSGKLMHVVDERVR